MGASRLVLRRGRDCRRRRGARPSSSIGIGEPDEIAVVVDDDSSVVERAVGLGTGSSCYPTELFR